MARIFVVQHCQSEHHIKNLTGGWTDTPLTGRGIKQAKECGVELALLGAEDGTLIMSSDLIRAKMTAIVISTYLNSKLVIDSSLREMNNGVAANKTRQWARENRLSNESNLCIDQCLWENAETPRQLYQRIGTFYESRLKDLEEDVIVVSHGVAISYLVAHYLGLSIEQLQTGILKGDPGGITILDKSRLNQNQVKHFNLIGHL